MPGGRVARGPSVLPKAEVRALLAATTPGGRGVQARGCRPRDAGASPARASIRKAAPSRGRRRTARTPVRHIGDEGSNPSDHTSPAHTPAGEVLKARTLGLYPRGSGFDPRRRLPTARCEDRGFLHLHHERPARADDLRSRGPRAALRQRTPGLEALTSGAASWFRQAEVRALPRPRRRGTRRWRHALT